MCTFLIYTLCNSCNLQAVPLPIYTQWTRLVIDIFHVQNHSAWPTFLHYVHSQAKMYALSYISFDRRFYSFRVIIRSRVLRRWLESALTTVSMSTQTMPAVWFQKHLRQRLFSVKRMVCAVQIWLNQIFRHRFTSILCVCNCRHDRLRCMGSDTANCRHLRTTQSLAACRRKSRFLRICAYIAGCMGRWTVAESWTSLSSCRHWTCQFGHMESAQVRW